MVARVKSPPEPGHVADETFKPGEGGQQRAGEAGRASAEVVAQRRALARKFYEEQGFPPDKVDSHLDAVDFDKPVDAITVPRGTVLE